MREPLFSIALLGLIAGGAGCSSSAPFSTASGDGEGSGSSIADPGERGVRDDSYFAGPWQYQKDGEGLYIDPTYGVAIPGQAIVQ